MPGAAVPCRVFSGPVSNQGSRLRSALRVMNVFRKRGSNPVDHDFITGGPEFLGCGDPAQTVFWPPVFAALLIIRIQTGLRCLVENLYLFCRFFPQSRHYRLSMSFAGLVCVAWVERPIDLSQLIESGFWAQYDGWSASRSTRSARFRDSACRHLQRSFRAK